jgi:5-methylcytosine-specific restriction enzyme subunit McrC
MYIYCRFWDAEKAMLLYPGYYAENKFKSYLTDDYSKHKNDEASYTDHQCKMGFVSVLGEDGELDRDIGNSIIQFLEETLK